MRTVPSSNEVIAHPVRLRIIGALAGQELTTQQLGELLDDVPAASLYRHISLLIEVRQVKVVGEISGRGGTTRRLALEDGAGLLNRQSVDPDSPEENSLLVNAFLTRQMAGYASALRDPSVRPGDWKLRGSVVSLSQEEEGELADQILALIEALQNRPPAPGRRRRNLFIGILPERDLPTSPESVETP